MLTPENLAYLNDLRSRVLRARDLRAAGDTEGALNVEPTTAELRTAFAKLHEAREASAATPTARPAGPPPSLADLIAKVKGS